MPDYTPPTDAELAEMRERYEKAAPNIDVTRDAFLHIHNYAMRKTDKPYMSIPADPTRDGDLLVMAAIRELEQARTDLPRCLAYIDWLKSELRLWKPMTPEEAEEMLAEVEAEPASEEEINRILKNVLDPANRMNNREECQVRQKILSYRLLLKLKDDEIAALRSNLSHAEGDAR